MLLIRLATGLFSWLRDQRLLKQGEDRAVARAAKVLLDNTETGKRLRDEVNKLDTSEEDKLWDRMIQR
jgi:hypothetical protein